MALVDLIVRARAATWFDENGKPIDVEFHPGLDESEIKTIEERLGVPLPADYRELLTLCGGIEGPWVSVDFEGEEFEFGMDELVPHSLAFAGDGCGNYWLADLTAEPESQTSVFYACHDAPVYLFQCLGMETFLEEFIKLGRQRGKSAIQAVHDDEPFDVWQKNPSVLSRDDALAGDNALAEFARNLGPDFQFIDLRNAPTGMGFSWGRFGPKTEIRRHGDHRIFAYAPPKKKVGFLKRLFGK